MAIKLSGPANKSAVDAGIQARDAGMSKATDIRISAGSSPFVPRAVGKTTGKGQEGPAV